MTVEICNASAADETAFRSLWDQYLVFYKVDLAPEVTAATWSRLLDPPRRSRRGWRWWIAA